MEMIWAKGFYAVLPCSTLLTLQACPEWGCLQTDTHVSRSAA